MRRTGLMVTAAVLLVSCASPVNETKDDPVPLLPPVGSPTSVPGVLSVAESDVEPLDQLQLWDAPLVEDWVEHESVADPVPGVEDETDRPVPSPVMDLLDELVGTEDEVLVGPLVPDTTKVVPPPRG